MALSRSDVDKLPGHARKAVLEQLGQAEGGSFPKPGKRNKFGNRKSEGFDSNLERRYWDYLQLREKAGEIKNLRKQVCVDLPFGRRYMRIDFVYLDVRLGEVVYDDTKGMIMPDWKVKADIWAAGFGPGRLRIIRFRGGAWVCDAEYLPVVSRRVLEALRGQLSKADLEFLAATAE
ncbi:MAG: hypothetical protein IMZ50_15525 [Candidatus Atribacteria bacterium]|nr:hypothetical protein [Candidatus Atribacteria bacterium]